ncbi:MAG: cytochrome P460 family protein [Rhodospirillales bacterium]|nr:cytochrome P460 family protein [Rhodospirillales bacterium]
MSTRGARKGSILIAGFLIIALALGLGAARTQGQTTDDPLRPKRHFDVTRPANLTPNEALTIYENIADEMAGGYAVSRDPSSERFRNWRRYNMSPYKSATHGNRYINNYANQIAVNADYGGLPSGARMPVGSILAKDSFTVTADTAVFAGALFIMEKMPAGTKPEFGDWRYIMILPDGSYFGDSEGENAAAVNFCHDCHKAVAKKDFLFFVPKKYRVNFLK